MKIFYNWLMLMLLTMFVVLLAASCGETDNIAVDEPEQQTEEVYVPVEADVVESEPEYEPVQGQEPEFPAGRVFYEFGRWTSGPSLKEHFADFFLIGNIWNSSWQTPGGAAYAMDADTRAFFLHNFNAITAEDYHKIDQMTNSAGNLINLDRADAIVNFAYKCMKYGGEVILQGFCFV